MRWGGKLGSWGRHVRGHAACPQWSSRVRDLAPQWKWGNPRKKERKKEEEERGAEELCIAKTSVQPGLDPRRRRSKPCWAGGKTQPYRAGAGGAADPAAIQNSLFVRQWLGKASFESEEVCGGKRPAG